MDLSLSPRHAFLLEDDPADREALERLCARDGWRVTSVESLSEARALIAAGFLPTVALIDLHIPPDDTWGLIVYLQNHPAWRGVPLVVVSGRYDPQQGAAYLHTAGWLTKPVTLEALRDVLQRCVPSEISSGS